MPRPKEIAGGKYNNLLNLKTAIDAQKIIREERPDFFGPRIRELGLYDILSIAAVYLSALTRLEEEQEGKQRKEDDGKTSDQNSDWFDYNYEY